MTDIQERKRFKDLLQSIILSRVKLYCCLSVSLANLSLFCRKRRGRKKEGFRRSAVLHNLHYFFSRRSRALFRPLEVLPKMFVARYISHAASFVYFLLAHKLEI